MQSIMRSITFVLFATLVLVTCSHTDEPGKEYALVKIRELPAALQEISGITEYDGLLWGINDSGNEPVIYGYNRETNTVDRSLTIGGAVNTDWEEITQDAQHLYIGDFGNNSGDRKDLRIYIVDKPALETPSDTVDYSGLITFSYEDQDDFTPAPQNTPFDCESFAWISDSLVLFTKDWVNEQTAVYVLPARPGDYVARLRKRHNIAGLVTGASYSYSRQELLLVGYGGLLHFYPFIQVVTGFRLADPVFTGSERIDFDTKGFLGTQTEGIAHSEDGSVYVTSETLGQSAAALFRAEIRIL